MIKFRRMLLLTIVIAFVTSCQKNTEMPINKSNPAFDVYDNTQTLNKRVHYINQPISFDKSKVDLNFTLVASIEPPTVNGYKLSATCVNGTFGRAYVGFHAYGDAIGGELLSLDVSNPEEPTILQSAVSEHFEINDMYLSELSSKLWICGDSDEESVHQAYAMEFDLDANLAHADIENWTKYSSSNSGNSITETMINGESHLWFTSGKNGGLEVFPSSNPLEIIIGFDAVITKHFDANESYGVVVIGIQNDLSIVRVYDFNNNNNFVDYQIPYTLESQAKNGIFVDNDKAYLAMGSHGLLVMNLMNGEIVSSFQTTGGNANSVFIEKDYIYLAYGGAGLFILDKLSMENLGNYNYDGSCNFVFVDHDMVYLANGNDDGFLILKNDSPSDID